MPTYKVTKDGRTVYNGTNEPKAMEVYDTIEEGCAVIIKTEVYIYMLKVYDNGQIIMEA